MFIEPEVIEAKPSLTLEARVSALEAKIEALEDKTKVTKSIQQIVIDKEGESVKVRAKVFITTPTESREEWQDVTETYPEAVALLSEK